MYSSAIGYCQGMNFVAAIFLFQYLDPKFDGYNKKCDIDKLKDRWYNKYYYSSKLNYDKILEDTLWMMVCTIDTYGLREFWTPGIPGLPVKVYQFDRIFRRELEDLRKHCVENELFSDFFVAQWFITLFAYLLPPQSLCRVWDIFFSQGWSFIFRLSFAILNHLRPKLLLMDLMEMCVLLKDLKKFFLEEPDLIIELINISNYIKIDDEMLIELEKDFNAKEFEKKSELLPTTPSYNFFPFSPFSYDDEENNNPSMTAICASLRHKIEMVTERIESIKGELQELLLINEDINILYEDEKDRKSV